MVLYLTTNQSGFDSYGPVDYWKLIRTNVEKWQFQFFKLIFKYVLKANTAMASSHDGKLSDAVRMNPYYLK